MAVFQLLAALFRLMVVVVSAPFLARPETHRGPVRAPRVPTRRVLGGWMYTPPVNDGDRSPFFDSPSNVDPAIETSLCDLEVLDRELFEAYSVIGVPVDASPEEIDQAFKARLAGNSKRVTHEAGTVVQEISARRVKQLRKAYEEIRRFQGR